MLFLARPIATERLMDLPCILRVAATKFNNFAATPRTRASFLGQNDSFAQAILSPYSYKIPFLALNFP